MPPPLVVANTDSLGEQIQRAFPETKVVKALNTMTAQLMANPRQVAEGDQTVFLSRNDQEAKAQVTDLLRSLGWTDILDLGAIDAARGMEMMLPIWLRLFGVLQKPFFQFKIVR